jgi:hypothetical protein
VFLIVVCPGTLISQVMVALFEPELVVAIITGKLPGGNVAVNGNFTLFF